MTNNSLITDGREITTLRWHQYENSQSPSDDRTKALLPQNELHRSNVPRCYQSLDGALDNIEEYGPIVCRMPIAIVGLADRMDLV
jgi:hypothetical protein